MENGNTYYDSRNNCNAIIHTATNKLIAGCKNTTIPNSVSSIGFYSFYGCSGLTSVTIPNSVTSIGEYAFSYCKNLTSVIIPNSVTSIGGDAFGNCISLTSVNIPNSVSKIGSGAFSGCCGLTSVTISNNLNSISQETFACCEGLTSLIIPNSVSNIGSSAFNACRGLTSVTIGNGIHNIKDLAFAYCSNLKDMYCYAKNVPSTAKSAFKNSYIESVTLHVPETSINSYSTTIPWNDFENVISIEIKYSLTISATGNGSATYNNTTVRGKTQTFSLVEGTDATIAFTPDAGYRIGSVMVNGSTVSVSNNQYTVSNITSNTSVSVTFEQIPPTYYNLTLTASGNGSATLNGTSVRNGSQTFSVTEGSNTTITFSPDNGYRVKSVKVNNMAVSISNNQYTVNNISSNTTVAVEFEAIPSTTYTLTIKATGNGTASYNGTTVRGNTKTFTVNKGTNATIAFSPDNGYRIKSVKANGSSVTLSNNQYTFIKINLNLTVEVEFEAIPQTNYELTITAKGNGNVSYNGTTIRGKTNKFTVNDGTNVTISFSPDNGYQIKSVKVNNSAVSVSNSQYTVSNIKQNTTVEVIFEKEEEVVTEMDLNGKHYDVLSAEEATVSFGRGNYSGYVVIPEEIGYNNKVWRVVAIADEAFKDCKEVITVTVGSTIESVGTNVFAGCEKLAAIVWNAKRTLTSQAMNGQENPNLLLYVSDKQYAPSTFQNVIVNGTANRITLTDDARCNTFYCPMEFTAQAISYSHLYSMTTGKGDTRGWETIALPFTVQKITHQSKGTLVPFANYDGNSSSKPFWLYSYGNMGWQATGAIDAYEPYLISMPHNQAYKADYDLAGMVTFSAQNVRVSKTPETMTASESYHGGRMRANFSMTSGADGKYALNVSNELETNTNGMTEGSVFVKDLRPIRPFEAYLEMTAETRSVIPVFDDETTGISELENMIVHEGDTNIYDLQGRKVERPLKAGVYIMNGKKKMIK